MDRSLEIDNRSLVEECLKGDKDALNLFYLRFAPRMHRVIKRYVHDRKDSEDILHDGFIVALTRLRFLREPEKVDYWLASIMKNLSLQFLQEQDVAELLNEDEVEDVPVIDNIIDMEVLESLIKKLPPGYQKVFRLSILEKKSHKEIARILGIAPNSSSSQLFHAKLMMRQLITDYRKQAGLLSLLLLGMAGGTLFWINRASHRSDQKFAVADTPVIMTPSHAPTTSTELPKEIDVPSMLATSSVDKDDSNKPHSGSSSAASQSKAIAVVKKEASRSSNAELMGSPAVADTLTTDRNLYADADNTLTQPDNPADVRNDFSEEADVRNDLAEKMEKKADRMEKSAPVQPTWKRTFKDYHTVRKSGNSAGRWSFIAKADPGLSYAFNSEYRSNSFGDYIIGNPSKPDDQDKDTESRHGLTRGESNSQITTKDFSKYTHSPHKNDFPISFTLAVSHGLNERIGLEAGLSYTYLSTTFEYDKAYARCRWHYLGIPLRVTFRSFTTGRLKLYGALGGSLEVPLHSSADIWGENAARHLEAGAFTSPCVWTVSGSYGAALKLSERFDLFIEPTVQIYLHNKATVPNTWSDNRVGFSLPIGLRFNL